MIAGILGGTFDPPHLGHLGVARAARDSGEVDEVWLVPCRAHALGKAPTPFEHRLAMCRLLVRGERGISVSDIEGALDLKGRTLDLVRAVSEAHPGVGLRLVAGADIYHERHLWHRYDEVARLAPPLYVGRRGVAPIPERALPAPPEISSSAVREALSRGDRPEGWVPSAILDYITERGLYGGGG